MDLKEYCYSLNESKLCELAIKLCEKALFIWDEYGLNNSLSYRDTVVGLTHNVRPKLLYDSIQFCKANLINNDFNKRDFDKLYEEFRDPIVAMQDLDWELPEPIECVFYAVYNLLKGHHEKTSTFDELIHYVAVNQAVDALMQNRIIGIEEIKKLIYQ